MATIDLGKIKLVWRGTYNNGTAYTVDDVVQYTDSSVVSSYICTTNSTGNAPSSSGTAHGSWAYLAKGGSTYTSTLTTQGDILYRDGSGEARLAKGTASQVLKMNTGATAPEWGNLSSDFVKITSGNHSSDVNSVSITNCFSATYDLYEASFYDFWNNSNGDEIRLELLNSSGNNIGSSNIMTTNIYGYIGVNSNSTGNGTFGQDNSSDGRFFSNDVDSVNNEPNHITLRFYDPFNSTKHKTITWEYVIRASNNHYYAQRGAFHCKFNTSIAGIKFKNSASANFEAYKYGVWGIKR